MKKVVDICFNMKYIISIANEGNIMTNLIAINDRKCEVEGCNKVGQHMGKYRTDGSPIRRAKCSKHHSIIYGLNGWDYKQHRKVYCENVDGRLGFTCTSTIIDAEWQLDADHINGNPSDNRPENIQTLCKCCHPIKTMQEQDYLTAGRKAYGVK
jgi:5-methylcytosine-specific restriction endonuclease McrA|tara:strand:- start:56 stop:517 length:462 start_codon:yes stop_codon:yes gene_type:complete